MPTSALTDERDLSAEPESGPYPVLYTDPLDVLGPAGHLGDRAEIEKELDLIAAVMRTFHKMQPDQVMRLVAGFSARLTELEVLLHRVEAGNRQYTRIRTQQVERYLTELDRQFKIASRMVELLRQDLELMK